jgi:hypothetical protein
MATSIGNKALKNPGKSKPPQQMQPTKPLTPLLSEWSENHHAEEQIDAILKQGIDALMETAKANGPLAKNNFNKLKLAIMKDLATSQVQLDRRNSESPESKRTEEESPILPRRASKSPDHSQAPYVIVDYQPTNRRTSRSPTQKKMTNRSTMPGHRGESPSGYRIERRIDLHGIWTRV